MKLSASPASNVVPFGHATGPRTDRGKRVSSQNALSHGLYSSATVLRHIEDPAEFERFARAVVAELGIETPLAMALAERLISALWRQRRVRKYETAVLSEQADVALAFATKTDEARKRAFQHEAAFQAIWQAESSTTVPFKIADQAASAVSEYLDEIDGYDGDAFCDLGYRTEVDVESGARGPANAPSTVTRRRFYAAVDRARRDVPPEIALSSRADFLRMVERFHIELHRAWSKKADELEGAAREKTTSALMAPLHTTKVVSDAESRLDRQITRYIADLESVGCDVIHPRRRRERTVS